MTRSRRSAAEWELAALKVIPGGASTLAKMPDNVPASARPSFAESCDGARFTDVDGREWLDFDLAVGSVVWGHGRREISEAIGHVCARLPSAPVRTTLEVEAAEALLQRLSAYEQVRFFKTGADTVSAAVRLARAATRRDLICAAGYHGWHDWCAYHHYGERGLGIPEPVGELTLKPPATTVNAVLKLLADRHDELAAVVVRPDEWSRAELLSMKQECQARGVVFVFDEITAHFKCGRLGAAGWRDVWPDLLCISKGLANGSPLAAMLGPRHLMQRCLETRISTTYAGEPIALAAMIACETLLEAVPSWPSWSEHLAGVRDMLAGRVLALGLQDDLQIDSRPGYFWIGSSGRPFRDDPFRLHVVKELGAQGLFTRGWFHGSDAHSSADFSVLGRSLDDALISWRIAIP
jgi:glutamate-1-semialdehyde 2,1-aminomutase